MPITCLIILFILLAVLAAALWRIGSVQRWLVQERRFRKAADEKHRFQADLLEQIEDLVVAADMDHVITYVNAAAARCLQKTPEELIGKGIEVLQTVGPIDAFQNRNMKTRTHLIRNADGVPAGMAWVSTDVTDMVRFAEALADAKEAAEAASLTKSAFLANMSHEIRTPMNAILGFAELMAGRMENEKDQVYLNNILSSGRSLLCLINDILDLSKIEAGKIDIAAAPFDVKKLLFDMEAHFAPLTSRKGLSFYLEVDEALPQALVMDENRLQQILVNLLGNAIKFTDAGFIRLSAQVGGQKTTGNCVDAMFCVEDTGYGIRADALEKIFDAFEQTASGAGAGGAGLGLSISRRLAKLMNGDIQVESVPGKGSRFLVVFRDVLVAAAPTASATCETEIDASEFVQAKVLVVDDMESNRILLRGFLDASDLEVVEAESGEDALEKAAKIRPDIVLMDIRMPGMGGKAAIDRMKADPALKTVPVVVVTASVMKDSEAAYAGLADGFLGKPLKRAALMSELSRFLPRKPKSRLNRDFTDNPVPEMNLLEAVKHRSLSDADALARSLWEILSDRWEAVRDIYYQDEVEELADLVMRVASDHGVVELVEWAEALKDSSMNSDLATMETRVTAFEPVADWVMSKHFKT